MLRPQLPSPLDEIALRSFASFAEDANLSRAAKRLHLSQPAVHAQIKRLEEALGCSLYRRVGRSLALTPEGVEVGAFAREQEGRTRELFARLHHGADDARVVLAAGAGALLHVLGPAMRAFTRASHAPLEVLTTDGPTTLAAVRDGSAHVGVAALAEIPTGLDVARVTEIPQVLVVPRDHPLARRRAVRLEALAGARLVLPPVGRPQRAILDAAFAARGISVHAAATAVGWELVVHLAAVGAGLAVVNACVALPRGLVARPLPELPKVQYLAFTRPRPRRVATELLRAVVAHGEDWRRR